VALLFLDSFDHYSTPADKYTQGSGTPVAGRHGKGLVSSGCIQHLTPAHGRCVLGAAWRIEDQHEDLYRILDHDMELAFVGTGNDGSLRVQVGAATVSSAVDVLKLHQWYFIEVDLTWTVTLPEKTYMASVCTVYVDGLPVIDVTNLGPTTANPDAVSAFGWTGARHGGLATTASIIDDFYVLDGSGPAPWNAPLGDVQIDVIRPNGVGASTEWTPTGATANWEATNDLTPDDAATTVSATSAGLADLYAMEDVNTDDGIIGAQILVSASRTEEGFATLTPLLRHAGVTTPLVTRAVSPSYFYRNRDVFVTMPNGDPLTDVNVNALQAGIRRDL
jgi:hypothetical protein